MQAYVVRSALSHAIEDQPEPEPADGEVVLKVMACGLCGTDAHIFLGHYDATFPLVPGHEFAGVVARVGRRVKGFTEGRKVAADPNIFCGRCDNCKQNLHNFCLDFAAAGVTRNGGFAQYVAVPEPCVFDIGELDFTSAALIEPLACVVYGQERARPQIGDTVLILGTGPIGLLHLQLARHNGAAFVAAVDLREERLALARKLGADLVVRGGQDDGAGDGDPAYARLAEASRGGFNLVIDTTGAPRVTERAVGLVRSGGTLLVFGVCPQDSKMQVSPYEVYRRDLRIVGSFALKRHAFQPALDLLRHGVVHVGDIVGARVGLAELPACVEDLAAGRGRMKTVAYPNGMV